MALLALLFRFESLSWRFIAASEVTFCLKYQLERGHKQKPTSLNALRKEGLLIWPRVFDFPAATCTWSSL
ncbi:hypothetical protein SERLA73DRAFT_130236 [Serpula lacrymans var. lacrymans S7.3]|uniref:Secreted protein n=2 Tax=Serpula lacrymans var. lacrymans TaxID=341189 RepID=F8PJC6_SERL3|nr:uncharacterized protein SERLADRAFT_378746 [Serpula lacrymans var. lacrymans S7.9]XP_007320120.1 uncharacterized protein SERLADRAFT_393623 [Serpula lacrymans var. lacrymans S7.9]EGN91183.1 hypothetical protein SERLA73DRAFT_148693 [Serpula lacrymans var. lacrymans S7.3]EGO03751.1 hypothetical protein SERLA73DRAFT_130236 [Serpula lacrymans var. lacrymans S7.3]EGO22880.1 hypothetical protein SERLADRAFT_393623 [Serpula lacrymans var. lacrymans S7.9]EGO29618.1 hypothetical protein SERLADRAFT_3787